MEIVTHEGNNVGIVLSKEELEILMVLCGCIGGKQTPYNLCGSTTQMYDEYYKSKLYIPGFWKKYKLNSRECSNIVLQLELIED